MSHISMKSLLEAGVHFGHQTKRWNPKMTKYVFGKRNGIYIVDLQKTVQCFNQAYEFVRDMSQNGMKFLFVGTKKQAQDAVKDAAQRCNSFYVHNRWLGGTLTNFQTIKTRVQRMKDLEEMFNSGYVNRYKKKEVSTLKKEYDKLAKNLSGIKEMENVPDIMIVIDVKREMNAILEAKVLNIPIVAIVDTNSDPELVDFPIPGNDDAIRACQLIADRLAEGINEGRHIREDGLVDEIRSASQDDAEDDIPVNEIISAADAADLEDIKEEE